MKTKTKKTNSLIPPPTREEQKQELAHELALRSALDDASGTGDSYMESFEGLYLEAYDMELAEYADDAAYEAARKYWYVIRPAEIRAARRRAGRRAGRRAA